jgi:uncharacterized membrane protein
MQIFKRVGFIFCLALTLCFTLLLVFQVPMAIAADATAAPKLSVTSQYPSLDGYTTEQMVYDLNLQLIGGSPTVFNLSVTGPSQYSLQIREIGINSAISAIKLDPASPSPESVRVLATPNTVNPPELGQYTFTFVISSGDLKQTLALQANIKSRYSMDLVAPGGLLSKQITAGKDNYLYLTLTNTGNDTLKNISFTSTIAGSPRNWTVTFSPQSLDSLAANDQKEIKVDVKPDPGAVSGDYQISIIVDSATQALEKQLDFRVTVLSSTVWGWVGVAILVVIIAGLALMFKFVGRR